jgi:murein DD-endopeptidase MepM/ murein hydrolase activator NlpD
LRLTAAFSLLLLSACATPPVREKMSFEEAFAEPEPAASPPTRTQARKVRLREPPAVQKPDGDLNDLMMASTAPELDAALARFVTRARAYREQLAQGSAMPHAQVENWVEVGNVVDAFLRTPPRQMAPFDVVRARVTLEAELEEDARAYGDIPTTLAESVTARVARLAQRMNELKRMQTKATAAAPLRFTWPINPVSVTSLYGSRRHPVTGKMSPHRGLDLAAERGQAIYTAAPGVVLRAGWSGSYGLMVEVQHTGKVTTRYSHLSQVLVGPGEVLERGDVVGLAGDTGLATGVHLHFEVWRDGEASDPLDELEMPEEPERLNTSRFEPRAVQPAPPPAKAPEKRQGRRPTRRRP